VHGKLFLFALARGVTRIALGLLFGLKRCLAGGFFFLLACGLHCGLSCRLGLARPLFGLGCLAGFPGFGARIRLRLALGLTLLHLRIVRSRLGAKFVQDVLFRL
jgi:hypothetical protein